MLRWRAFPARSRMKKVPSLIAVAVACLAGCGSSSGSGGTGGTPATGGASATGGMPGTGGTPATGGASGTGGMGGAGGGLPALTVVGNKLQDPTGKTIVLRGSSLIDIGALYAYNGNSAAGITNRMDKVAAAGVQG